jgi:hypothetical protein
MRLLALPVVGVVVATFVVPSAARAQNAPAPASVFSVVTYYRCAQGDAPRAEHMFGGESRRSLIVDAKDEKTLFRNWSLLQDEVQKAAPDLSRRMSQICHSHADYIWQKGLQ